MSDYYEEAARARRSPGIQAMLDSLAQLAGIEREFIAASDHPYDCRCHKCLGWWASMGPDGEPDGEGAFGPFSKEEVELYCKANDKEVWW